MVAVRFLRFAMSIALSVALALLAVNGSTEAAGPGFRKAAGTTYPTNAAKIFRWGSAQWHDEFVNPLDTTMWRVTRPDLIRNQHGMLTLNATGTSGSVGAVVVGHNRRYGRWEARVRGRQYTTGGTPYHAVWELTPMYGGYHCAARNVLLSDYALGSDQTTMRLRNLPDQEFTAGKAMPLGDNEFHTYAVEVTPDHVSWFVDTRVVMTERRPAALSAAVFAARFRLVGTPGARMNTGRMQMDWVRYYTLDRPNAQPITAPQSTPGTYAGAC